MVRIHLIVVLFVALFGAVVYGQTSGLPERLQVPSAAAQAESMNLIRELYKADWEQAKLSPEKQALAKKILRAAVETKNEPADHFVLLRLAKDIATQAGDAKTAFQSVDETAKAFQVEPLEAKVLVLESLLKTVMQPEQHKFIVAETPRLIKQAIAADNYELARTLGATGITCIRPDDDPADSVELRSRINDAHVLAKAYASLKDAVETLASKPDDPTANLAVGKFECLLKGNWKKGLPMLARGDDAELKALAATELDGPKSAVEQVKLADGWLSFSGKEEGIANRATMTRARGWYRKALPQLSGVRKEWAEKQIEQIRVRYNDDAETEESNPVTAGPDKPRQEMVGSDQKAESKSVDAETKGREPALETPKTAKPIRPTIRTRSNPRPNLGSAQASQSPPQSAAADAAPFSKLRSPVRTLVFSPTGRHLYLTPRDMGGKKSVWRVSDWQEIKAASEDCDYFGEPAVFSPEGDFLACMDGELIRIWSLKSTPASLVNTFQGRNPNRGQTKAFVWASDGTLVAENRAGGLQFYKQDANKGAVPFASVGERDEHGRRPSLDTKDYRVDGNFVVSERGNAFASFVTDPYQRQVDAISLWAIPSGNLLGFLQYHEEKERWYDTTLSLSPDLVVFAGLPDDGDKLRKRKVSLWKTAAPRNRVDLQAIEINPEGIGTIIDFRFRCSSPDGRIAVTSGKINIRLANENKVKHVITLWDASSGKKLLQLNPSGTKSVFFSPDGNTLVTGGADDQYESRKKGQSVDFWNVRTGQPGFQVVDTGISSAVLSPDGKLLITTYYEQSKVGMWKVK